MNAGEARGVTLTEVLDGIGRPVVYFPKLACFLRRGQSLRAALPPFSLV